MGAGSPRASCGDSGKKNSWRRNLRELNLSASDFNERWKSGKELPSEPFLDLALTDWLPANKSASKHGVEGAALRILAAMLIRDHKDAMLRDMLSGAVKTGFASMTATLARAIRENTAGDRETGYRLASQAAGAFRSIGNRAGELRASEEAVYALSRSFRTAECLEESGRLLRNLGRDRYPWIRVQVLLARATCMGRLGDVGTGIALKEKATRLAEEHGYQILLLRAIGLTATSSTLIGDLAAARRQDHAGLERFWKGAYPPLRAYQFYSDLSNVAEKDGSWETGYAESAEAVPMIQATGNLATEAMARYRLAFFAGLTGRGTESARQIRAADSLLKRLGDEKSTRILRAESLIGMATAWLAQGKRHLAMTTLDTIRDEDTAQSILLQLGIHRARATAALLEHRNGSARKELRAALSIAEASAKTIRSARDRANWQAGANPLYREFVELVLEDQKEPERALAIWEKFRSSAVTDSGTRPDGMDFMRGFAKSLKSASVISFVQFEDYLAGWLFDDRGIVPFRSPLSAKEAARTCGKFRELTASKNSDLESLHRTGRALFDALVGPVENRLDETRTLALEPDGPCSGIAFEALSDRNGAYLADRFVLVTSPGAFAAEWWSPDRYRLSPDLQAVIVGDPRLSGDLGSIYPELPDAQREARGVAHLFRRNMVFTGKSATLEAVERSLPQAEIFHFAGHGVSTSENGTLLLSAPGSAAGVALFDSMRAEAAAGRCHLAVLSACFSAGESHGPFAVNSLVQAFWRAGVPNVLAARWAVDSGVTRDIVSRFYPLLLRGMPPAAALHESARVVRRDPAFSHPAFWAGFHIFGSPITIDKEIKP